MLIANAGIGIFAQFEALTYEEVQSGVAVNALHPVFTIKTLLAQMTRNKSAIIVTSSGLGQTPVCGIHSACKSFSSFIAESLSYELRGKVDVLSYMAGETTTKMLGRDTTDMHTVSAERAVQVCFRDLGHTPMTRGAFRHEVGGYWSSFFPLRWNQASIMNNSWYRKT